MPTDTPLHKAANNGDLDKVKECVEGTGDETIDVNEAGAAERRPIHRAAGSNHLAVVQYLTEKGADVNMKDKSGRTPLHWCCIGGHKEVAEFLLANGVNVNDVTTSQMTPLHAAVEGGKVECARFLLKNSADTNAVDGDGKKPFDIAAAAKNKAMIIMMKEEGDENAKSAACVIS